MDLGLNYLVGIWTHLDTWGGGGGGGGGEIGLCRRHREERVEPRERGVIVVLFLGLGPVLVSRE